MTSRAGRGKVSSCSWRSRRIEKRLTGVRARTDRKSFETRGPHTKGRRQRNRGPVPQCPEWREKTYTRGLDNSGNIEGNLKHFLRRRLGSAPPAHPSGTRRRPRRAHGASRTPSAARQPARAARQQGGARRRATFAGAGQASQDGVGERLRDALGGRPRAPCKRHVGMSRRPLGIQVPSEPLELSSSDHSEG